MRSAGAEPTVSMNASCISSASGEGGNAITEETVTLLAAMPVTVTLSWWTPATTANVRRTSLRNEASKAGSLN